jgi:hypothetical protein
LIDPDFVLALYILTFIKDPVLKAKGFRQFEVYGGVFAITPK